MPLPLLLALFLAFGFDAVGGGPGVAPPEPFTRAELLTRAGEAAAGVGLVAAAAFVLGRAIVWRVRRRGDASRRVRRAYGLGVRGVDVLSLVVFGWTVHEAAWPRVVRQGLGLDDPVLVDDALILLPFLLAQVAGWWGLYAGENAIRRARGARPAPDLGRHLVLKARQSLGMVLPVAALYGLGTDLVHRVWPSAEQSPWDQPVSLAVMGGVVLLAAPALVRVAWPTRPLPPGPLRDRLERLARRLGFRCTDILVWDTNHVVVNAGVTGPLPWFRYVLLTDALVEDLTPHEVAAVFGHEVGHIAHRHLSYFGFFILTSLVVLASGEIALGRSPAPAWLAERAPRWLAGGSAVALTAQAVAAVAVVGAYFLLVFGFVSRRFERQADVFGCRAVSCGLPDCPPHLDVDGRPGGADVPAPPPPLSPPRRGWFRRSHPPAVPLCPVGIRIFINALTRVAVLNGMRPTAWSWRHGSIVRRIAFLEQLEGRPEAERRFQAGISRMRLGMAAALALAMAALAKFSGGPWW